MSASIADDVVIATDTRGRNLYEDDASLRALLPAYLGANLRSHIEPHLSNLGYRVANDLDEHAQLANANPPKLIPRDRYGRDRQSVEYHPSYRELEQAAYGDFEIHALSHRGALGWPEPMPLVAKHAFTYLFNQTEFGLGCPINVTDATADLIVRFGSKELQEQYLSRMLSNDLDELLQGGQFMTEQEGGSDVGRITTRAVLKDGKWRIFGEKWFCSNADAGAAALLARPEGAVAGTRGLGLFLVPRVLESGEQNSFRIVRLKEKLGTRSMASGEIAFEGAVAHPIGDLERGFLQMTQMMNWSRLSNGVKSSALMRRAVHDVHAVARSRKVFGQSLYELPLSRRQLLKIMLPAEQSLSMWLFVGAQLDKASVGAGDETDRAALVARLATPVLKMRATRDARKVTSDAMEFRGGTGYTEDFVNSRLLRDAQLGSIWEGTTNIVAIDVVRRAIARTDCLDPYCDELARLLDVAASVNEGYRRKLLDLLQRIKTQAETAANEEREHEYRQVTSNLYHVATAILMAWEAHQTGDGLRLLWSDLVKTHRLDPADPTQIISTSEDVATRLLLHHETDIDEANRLVVG